MIRTAIVAGERVMVQFGGGVRGGLLTRGETVAKGLRIVETIGEWGRARRAGSARVGP